VHSQWRVTSSNFKTD